MPTILCSTMIHPIDYEAQAIKSNKYMDQQATARSFYFVSYTAQIVEQVNIASMWWRYITMTIIGWPFPTE